MLDPNVGAAVQAGDLTILSAAEERVTRAVSIARSHPVVQALAQLGLVEQQDATRDS
jgi:hypothetical protein